MRFHLYTHSLVSDWNHGNAHFLRGIMRDLQRRGHQAIAYEPQGTRAAAYLAEVAEQALQARTSGSADLSRPTLTRTARAAPSQGGRNQSAFLAVFGVSHGGVGGASGGSPTVNASNVPVSAPVPL